MDFVDTYPNVNSPFLAGQPLECRKRAGYIEICHGVFLSPAVLVWRQTAGELILLDCGGHARTVRRILRRPARKTGLPTCWRGVFDSADDLN